MEADSKKVFVIHGRNFAAKNAVEQFLRTLKLEPVDFDELAADLGACFLGDIVREGMKRAQGILALFTADEFASLRAECHQEQDTDEDKSRWQARPNVIFEAGMAYGIAPERTILVVLGNETKLFSDVSGIHLTYLDNSQNSRGRFRQKLIGARCAVDLRTDAWLDPKCAGDFDACALNRQSAANTAPNSARPLSDAGALLKLEAWVKKLPLDRHGDAIFTAQIDKECGLATGTAERLIVTATEQGGDGSRVRGPVDGIVVFSFEMRVQDARSSRGGWSPSRDGFGGF
jgi:hypothetical protein